MIRRIMSELDLARNISIVQEKIKTALLTRNTVEEKVVQPRLVAVSKTKPKELIIEAYKVGLRHFGENYIQELAEKSTDDEILTKCPEIQWHFIGHLQRNKVNKLVKVPNLFVVETIDSEKLAVALNSAWEKEQKEKKCNVMIQVNTSGEIAKSGCKLEEVIDLYTSIVDKCSSLKVIGLMTIGQYDNYSSEEGINPDFQKLIECRKQLSTHLEGALTDFELSMGMSGDFEHAIEVGSTNVRVGSSIFGARNYEQ